MPRNVIQFQDRVIQTLVEMVPVAGQYPTASQVPLSATVLLSGLLDHSVRLVSVLARMQRSNVKCIYKNTNGLNYVIVVTTTLVETRRISEAGSTICFDIVLVKEFCHFQRQLRQLLLIRAHLIRVMDAASARQILPPIHSAAPVSRDFSSTSASTNQVVCLDIQQITRIRGTVAWLSSCGC